MDVVWLLIFLSLFFLLLMTVALKGYEEFITLEGN